MSIKASQLRSTAFAFVFDPPAHAGGSDLASQIFLQLCVSPGNCAIAIKRQVHAKLAKNARKAKEDFKDPSQMTKSWHFAFDPPAHAGGSDLTSQIFFAALRLGGNKMSFSHKARQGREENISSRKVAKTQRNAKEDFQLTINHFSSRFLTALSFRQSAFSSNDDVRDFSPNRELLTRCSL